MQKWQWEEQKGMKYLTIPHWREQGAVALFSSRQGGVSDKPYDSLNLALHVGDEKKRVLENRSRLLSLFNSSIEKMVGCEQVHGNRVMVVGPQYAGRGSASLETAVKDCDALVTSTPDLILSTYYADCIPLYFFDPVNKAVGLAHSGWKGTMQRTACACLETMIQTFDSRPQEVEVFIGPGIGSCCFKISRDLISQVNLSFGDFDGIINEYDNFCTWDLKRTNRLMLQQCGIKSENIYDCQLCTSCNPGDFYSYRRDQGFTGRMGAFIFVKN